MPYKIDRVFGCRSPSSKGIGKWNGAFVYCRDRLRQMIAYFDDNVDYINDEPITFNDAKKEYNSCIKKGWIPMSPEDLEKTSGVTIDEHTKLDIPDTDDFDAPIKQMSDMLPKENLEKMTENLSEYAKNLKEQNPELVESIINLVGVNEIDPENFSLNQAMNLGTKMLGSMDKNMLNSLMDVAKNMMSALSKDLPKGDTNSATHTINDLFNSYISNNSDEFNEFNKKSDGEKADEIIKMFNNKKNNPESFDDYLDEVPESDVPSVAENIQQNKD